MGLLPHEFMCMTPNEFILYHKQQVRRMELQKEISDRQTARICCILANINRNTKKKPLPFKEEDFLPKKKREKMSNEEIANVCKTICIAFGGEIK